MTSRAAWAGLAVLALVALASLSAWRNGSPLLPADGEHATDGTAWLFLILLVAAFVAYLVGLALARRGLPLRTAVAVAVAIQLVPLAAPLLLSTDAWTYWGYGFIGVEGGNPYADAPAAFPESPAAAYVGADWRETTSVYGPVFTLLSEPISRLAGSSPGAAAWLFKALAAAGSVATVAAVAHRARGSALAVAFVGWNPVLAIHLAGGGHNDALVAALVSGGVVLVAARRHTVGGIAWALAILVKWIPLVFLALVLFAGRSSGRRSLLTAVAGTSVLVGLVATWRYGLDWLGAFGLLAENASQETSYALPARLEQAGVPDALALGLALGLLGVGLAFLARDAYNGNARLGRAACLVLATTPYLAVWYLAWAVPLAALDDDRPARLAALGLTAYLLPQTIPL